MSSVIIYRHNQLKTLSFMLDPFIDKRTFANVGMNFTEHFHYTGQIITLDIYKQYKHKSYCDND